MVAFLSAYGPKAMTRAALVVPSVPIYRTLRLHVPL